MTASSANHQDKIVGLRSKEPNMKASCFVHNPAQLHIQPNHLFVSWLKFIEEHLQLGLLKN